MAEMTNNGSREDGAVAGSSPRFVVPANMHQLRPGRDALRHWLSTLLGVSTTREDEMVLVFMELLANAIEACRPSDLVAYSFLADSKTLVVRVENPNPFEQSVELRKMPDPNAQSGRGLALAQHYADRVDIDWMGGSVSISAHFGTQTIGD